MSWTMLALVLAIRMPNSVYALAPPAVSAYILRMNAPDVKLEKLSKIRVLPR